MKTPSEIVDGALGEKIPVTREGLEVWVAKIQRDAFEYGRSFGRRECADLFNRCQKDGSDFISELLLNWPKP